MFCKKSIGEVGHILAIHFVSAQTENTNEKPNILFVITDQQYLGMISFPCNP